MLCFSDDLNALFDICEARRLGRLRIVCTYVSRHDRIIVNCHAMDMLIVVSELKALKKKSKWRRQRKGPVALWVCPCPLVN